MNEGRASEISATADLRRDLMRWYRARGRHDLPWRLTREPYAVLVSEVMLQQTQVERVLPYYERWLRRWPTIAGLAAASPADVIREWAGLGYNRRALNLHRTAVEIAERYEGEFPRDVASLRALPGIGPYTAAAIASFAFGQPATVADTNIARVLARVVAGRASQRGMPGRDVSAIAESLLPVRDARNHNLALMDLGATVCTARAPDCAGCPIRRHCAWALAGSPTKVREPSRPAIFEETARFARGRIVEMLRNEPALSLGAIAGGLPGRHGKNAVKYLASLERDGLIEESGGTWRLPAGVTAG